jgi:hypothetical protein
MKPVTIAQAADHYAGTGLTRTAIRRAVLSGEVPSRRVGVKYLLTIEGIESWLTAPPVQSEQPASESIRRAGR